MNDWISVAFAVGMLLMMPAIAACVPTIEDVTDEARGHIRATMRWLWALAGAGSAFYIAWFIMRGEPFWFHSIWLIYPFILTLSINVMNAKQADPASSCARARESSGNLPAPTNAQVRTASLASRRGERYIPSWIWSVGWTFAVAAVAGVALRALAPFEADPERFRWYVAMGCVFLAPLQMLMAHLVLVRLITREPAPLDPQASPELVDAHAKLRRDRARALAVMIVVITAMLGAAMNLVAWLPEAAGSGRTAGVIGGVVGSLVGCAGAGIGIWCGVRTMQVHRLRRELTRSAPDLADENIAAAP